MSDRTSTIISNLAAASAIALLLLVGPQTQPAQNVTDPSTTLTALPVSWGPYSAYAFEQPVTDSPLQRIAVRLRNRLSKHEMNTPPLSALVTALEEQRTLLKRHVTVSLSVPGKTESLTWDVDLQRYPQWMKAEFKPQSARYSINQEAIAVTLASAEAPGVIPPVDTVLTEVRQDGKVTRAITENVARSGIVFDIPEATEVLAEALQQGTETLSLSLRTVNGTISNVTDADLGTLTLLSTGISDFSNSPWARIQNIRKALNQQVNNVLVPPGATFSFNDTLGGPVTQSNGWYDAKVIFDAVNLRMAPGGGICQASTTVFRAMLNAGFEEVERANHSMYVTYYEKHGVGIDATVFPGQQDLTFVNDTGNYLLLQALTDGNEARVNLYGTPDGRTAELRGPYFANSDLSDFPSKENAPHTNEIKWVQQITFADGRSEERTIISRYVTGLPRSLSAKYNALHAAAAASGATLVSGR